ncbi:hypothetical protein JCM10212_002027 [Sporobolomyces blumeae]
MLDSEEEYLVLLLSDSNLPTGGFVASSGLEAFDQHGYVPHQNPDDKERRLVEFVSNSLDQYAHLNAWAFARAHQTVSAFRDRRDDGNDDDDDDDDEVVRQFEQTVDELERIDELVEVMTLNHVARRASIAQGGAFLSLYARAFAPPPRSATTNASSRSSTDGAGRTDSTRSAQIKRSRRHRLPDLVERVRVGVKLASTQAASSSSLPASLGRSQGTCTNGKPLNGTDEAESMPSSSTRSRTNTRPNRGWKGHQSVAWGIVTSVMGLGLARATVLFLFLHARSLLSSAVRLNLVGPYVAHRLLWDRVKAIVDDVARKVSDEAVREGAYDDDDDDERDWWDDDHEWDFVREADRVDRDLQEEEEEGDGRRRRRRKGPVQTWPLGEIIASRHDQLFTKVFNS